jgi:hypothetical protein
MTPLIQSENASHFRSPCAQVTGNTRSCSFVNCFLYAPTNNIRTFRAVQQELLALPVCPNTLDSQAIFDIFYAENLISNYASYTLHNALHDTTPLVTQDRVPSSLLIAATIQHNRSTKPLKVLFDPGSDLTFLHQRCLPPGATPLLLTKQGGTTIAGTFTTNRFVTMHNVLLPKFHRSRKIDKQDCLIFTAECPYNVILGRDFLF